MKNFIPTPHPLMPLPTARQAQALGEQGWVQLLKKREEIILREIEDPIRYGWEPETWKLADALLAWPWLDKERTAQIQAALGFLKRVKVLFILGGNRGGKTEYAAKRSSRVMHEITGANIWPFHSTAPMSVETHHKLMWKFIPPELRRFIRSEIAYISYKQKTGFSDAKFVLPNTSSCSFKNYTMEKDDALQGPEIDLFWGDELIAADWVEDLLIRLVSRDGRGIVTFTPVQGYTPTVKMAQDGAEIVLEEPAFWLPKDGGEPDVARALGFDSEEEMIEQHERGVWTKPRKLIVDDSGIRMDTPAIPEGRRFESMPRIMKCVDDNYAIMFFHSSDGPFGKPHTLVEALRKKSTPYIKERWYGWANKTISCSFPKFNVRVHVIAANRIPAVGTNYMLCDPAKARNFFMKWYRVTDDAVYLYREWPSYYEVPGVGIPGAWALPDGKKLDGRPGPAQASFGFGLQRYKQEIARLEGWQDALAGISQDKQREIEEAARKSGQEIAVLNAGQELGIGQKYRTIAERDVRHWTPEHGTREIIFERFIDSRAASGERIENDRPRTLQTDFQDIGLDFRLTPGNIIAEGITLINDALDYDPELPLDYFNRPKFYVSEECRNSIFALQTWTGSDGQKGACKDPVDLDRYFFLSDCDYVDESEYWETSGGGHY